MSKFDECFYVFLYMCGIACSLVAGIQFGKEHYHAAGLWFFGGVSFLTVKFMLITGRKH